MAFPRRVGVVATETWAAATIARRNAKVCRPDFKFCYDVSVEELLYGITSKCPFQHSFDHTFVHIPISSNTAGR